MRRGPGHFLEHKGEREHLIKQKKGKRKMKKSHDDSDEENEDETGQELILIPSRDGASQKYGLVTSEAVVASDASQVLSIDDAIERLGMGPFQRRILIAAGLCFAADSMEVLLLSFLAVVLQAQWELAPAQTATITSSVFIGAMLGTLILGPLGDRIGRKPVFSATAAIIAVFGFGTAATNTFPQLLMVRFMVGFGVGGLTVPFDTLAEFVPTSHRGTNLLMIEYFWTFGTVVTPLIAYFTLGGGQEGINTNAWRWFVVVCAIPCLLSTILGLIFVPESPRWLITRGQNERAVSILRKAAIRNGKNPNTLFPKGMRLIGDDEAESTNVCDLLAPRWLRTTLFLWLAWGCQAFAYYGTIIAVTLVFASTDEDSGDQNGSGQDLTRYSFDYGAIMTSASAEIAGLTIVILLIDRVGRIPSQVGFYVAGGLSVFGLCFLAGRVSSSRTSLVVAAFLARMFYMGATCVTWVSTAEILTTEVRATGHSAANAIARIGGSASPYVVAASTPFTVIGSVMLAISLLASWALWHLPETKGKSMGGVIKRTPTEEMEVPTHPVPAQSSYGII